MRQRRGYVAAAFATSGDFVVHGGYDAQGDVSPTGEVFDVRAGRWQEGRFPFALPAGALAGRALAEALADATWLARAQHALVATVL